ncbi:MAG: low molecular weight phosphotyrosine protein phosphatase [Rhodobacteraceae bacterium]|nr:low molecular weight phosphotyrosine protein phosphatase [Paracoccaceae bacterium]
MFQSILVVCIGNICRSPVGERLLDSHLPGRNITSAGLGALAGRPADPLATKVAGENGVSLRGHRARQFTSDIAHEADLVLAMESGHRRDIIRRAPQLDGRVMLFDHWIGAQGIPDPFRRERDFHEAVFRRIDAAAKAWADRLTTGNAAP